MTRKIAIITTGNGRYDQYSISGYTSIVESITDWCEVTDEEFQCLHSMSGHEGYHLIEQPVDTRKFVKQTVADYLAYANAEQIRQEMAKKDKEAALVARKYKKDLKDQVSKEKLLAKLIYELGPDAVKAAININ
jgi:hypothetical protein